MNVIDYDNEYNELINKMADDTDLNSGELPHMYSDQFRAAAANRLLREKVTSKFIYDYNKFNALVDKSRHTGDILELVAKYLNKDEECDSLKDLAVVIADILAKNVLLYFREDIEDSILDKYKKLYQYNYYDSVDQIPHSL